MRSQRGLQGAWPGPLQGQTVAWCCEEDCGRIEFGEKIRNSGLEVLYLICLPDVRWRGRTDGWTQRCGIHARDISLGGVRM